MLKTAKYVRKPFAVEAVEVTPSNINDVAQWCSGIVKVSGPEEEGGREGKPYVKVPVKRPLSDRQTRAYYGDWVLLGATEPSGFKVYTPKAFTGSFDRQVDHMIETMQRMEARAAAEEKAEAQEETIDFGDIPSVNRSEVDPLRPFSQAG